MKNIIHMGFAKTGTSTLQNHVFPILARDNDILYLGKLYGSRVEAASGQRTTPLEYKLTIKGNVSEELMMSLGHDRHISKLMLYKEEFRRKFENKRLMYSNESISSKELFISNSNIFQDHILNPLWRIFSIHKIFDPIFLLSVREPVDWLWSLYRHHITIATANNESPLPLRDFYNMINQRFSMTRLALDPAFRGSLMQLIPNLIFFHSIRFLETPNTHMDCLAAKLGLRSSTLPDTLHIENRGALFDRTDDQTFIIEQKRTLDQLSDVLPRLEDIFNVETGDPILSLK